MQRDARTRPAIRRRPPPGSAPSRSTISRRRKRLGLVKVWLPRDVLEDLLLESGAIEEWDTDDDAEVQAALVRYITERTGEL